jgi:hypothetical protein
VQDCVDQKGLLHEILGPGFEDAPSALDHGDLAPLNIIVNLEYNVTAKMNTKMGDLRSYL